MARHSRVVWSSGTFLTPQLFEAQDSYFDSELRFRSRLTRFAQWGVSELEVDKEALNTGVFRITKCAGLFSDGFGFSIPGSAPLPPQQGFPLDGAVRDVFLSIAERRAEGANISASGKLRYSVRDETVYSEVDGQTETIQVADPRFELVFDGEGNSKDLLPIARIVPKSDGGYELSEAFIPPCLNAACSSHLWERLHHLEMRLSFVSAQLSLQRGQRSELLADFNDSDIRRFWVLHLVNLALPELRHIRLIKHVHPEDLYRFLLRLGGALFTFWRPGAASQKENDESTASIQKNVEEYGEPQYFAVNDFPPYNHSALGDCLPRVLLQIDTMLETMRYRRRQCKTIPLTPVRAKSHFRGKVSQEYLEKGTLYVALKIDPRIEIEDIEQVVKIVGKDTLPGVQSLAGVELKEVAAPTECEKRDGHVYYRMVQPSVRATMFADSPSGKALSTSGRESIRVDKEGIAERRVLVWMDIAHHHELHLMILNPAAVTNAELLIVQPESAGSEPLPTMPKA